MRNRQMLVLAGLTATLALWALVSTAGARRFGLSNPAFRATWSQLHFNDSSAGEVTCPATIEGSFHSRTIAKVAESLVGYFTSAVVGVCTGGTVRFLTEALPWHVRYEAFSGVLPAITSIWIRVLGFGFEKQTALGDCKYQATAAHPEKWFVNIASGGVAETLTFNETAEIPLTSGTFTCFANWKFQGITTTLTARGSTAKITVTLVQ